MVLKGYPRISETFISNEIRLLEKMGFTIHIYSMRAPRENFAHDSIKEIKAGVTYLPSSMIWGLPALLWYNLRLFFRHPRRYMRCVRLMLPRFRLAPKKHTWVKHLLQGGYIVQKSVLDQGVDLGHLHGHFAHTPTTVTMCAACLAGVPFSFTAHAKDIYTQDPRRIQDKIDLAKFVVTCTKYNARHLAGIAPDNKPIHCVYHGINLDLFSMNGRPLEAAPPYHVLTVARFVEKKGTRYHPARPGQTPRQGTRPAVHLGGRRGKAVWSARCTPSLTSWDWPTSPSWWARSPTTRLFGCSPKRIASPWAAAKPRTATATASPTWWPEAMATGVPVAATDISGVPELVTHKETGLLCASEDPDALAEIIEQALTNNALRRTIIPAARERVHAVFNNKQLIQNLGEIYLSHGVPCGK